MRETWTLCWKLLVIALIAGLALGVVYAVTKGPIEQQQVEAANAARAAVLPDAATFVEKAQTGVFSGYDQAGALCGYVTTGVCKGYGGEIEVTVGMDLTGAITGVNVGGSSFSETAGLGARTKEAAFRDQFIGMSGQIALKKDGGTVDAVTSATVSSRAVTGEVNALLAVLAAEIGG